jgi:hypothetical protein
VRLDPLVRNLNNLEIASVWKCIVRSFVNMTNDDVVQVLRRTRIQSNSRI